MPQCAVANCNNTHRKTKGRAVRYHRFPGDPSTRAKWLQSCGRHVQNWATSRVCSRHFSDDSYERDVQHELLGLPTRCRLKKGALPEKNLPFVSICEELSANDSSIAVLLAVGLVPNTQVGGLPQEWVYLYLVVRHCVKFATSILHNEFLGRLRIINWPRFRFRVSFEFPF